jgi:hypothetical protein
VLVLGTGCFALGRGDRELERLPPDWRNGLFATGFGLTPMEGRNDVERTGCGASLLNDVSQLVEKQLTARRCLGPIV